MPLEWGVTWSLAIDVTVPEENCVAWGVGRETERARAYSHTQHRDFSCDVKTLKLKLGKYLHLKSFYTLEEYYDSCKS
jgi:hypothetical protein